MNLRKYFSDSIKKKNKKKTRSDTMVFLNLQENQEYSKVNKKLRINLSFNFLYPSRIKFNKVLKLVSFCRPQVFRTLFLSETIVLIVLLINCASRKSC